MSYLTPTVEVALWIKPIFAMKHGAYNRLVGFLSNTFKQDQYDEIISLESIK